MDSETTLRACARQAIQTKRLPDRRPDRTWGGPGADEPCAVCERRITHEDLEFEIEFERGGPEGGLDKYHVHVRCFAAWEFERRRGPGRSPDDPPLPDKTRR